MRPIVARSSLPWERRAIARRQSKTNRAGHAPHSSRQGQENSRAKQRRGRSGQTAAATLVVTATTPMSSAKTAARFQCCDAPIARSTRIHISFFHDDCHGMTAAAAIEHRSAGANRSAQFYAARRRTMKPSMPSPVNSSTRVAGSGTGPPAATVAAAIDSSSAAIVGEIPSE